MVDQLADNLQLMQLQLAHVLCGKDIVYPLKKCYEKNKGTRPICSDSEDCEIGRLSIEQLAYIVGNSQDCSFLNACPGSGKTHVLGFKAAYEIANWEKRDSGIAFLSFTRNAAQEIYKRAASFSGFSSVKHPHYIGTFDSWIHGFIFQPYCRKFFQHKRRSASVLDSTTTYSFLNNDKYSIKTLYYGQRGSPVKIFCNQVFYDMKTDEYVWKYKNNMFSINDIFNSNVNMNSAMPKWLTKEIVKDGILKAKKALWNDGIYSYQDIEFISTCLLTDTDILEIVSCRFPIIYIDECQDLSYSQLSILGALFDADVKIHFVGDLNQSIYGFRHSSPDDIEVFSREHDMTISSLTINHRSGEMIANCCNTLAHEKRAVTGNQAQNIPTPLVMLRYDTNNIQQCIQKYAILLKNNNIDHACSVVLCRSYSGIEMLTQQSTQDWASNDLRRLISGLYTYQAKRLRTLKALESILENVGSFIGERFYNGMHDTKHYSCPEDISPSTWRCIIVGFAEGAIKSGLLNETNMILSDWLKKMFKPFLIENSDKLPGSCMDSDHLRSLICPKNTAKVSINQYCIDCSEESDTFQFQTIHQVKGRTFDSVMLVSSVSHRSEGHYKKWLVDAVDEAVRIAYVASSRPRKLLVWAVPSTIENEFVAKILSLGFKEIHD